MQKVKRLVAITAVCTWLLAALCLYIPFRPATPANAAGEEIVIKALTETIASKGTTDPQEWGSFQPGTEQLVSKEGEKTYWTSTDGNEYWFEYNDGTANGKLRWIDGTTEGYFCFANSIITEAKKLDDDGGYIDLINEINGDYVLTGSLDTDDPHEFTNFEPIMTADSDPKDPDSASYTGCHWAICDCYLAIEVPHCLDDDGYCACGVFLGKVVTNSKSFENSYTFTIPDATDNITWYDNDEDHAGEDKIIEITDIGVTLTWGYTLRLNVTIQDTGVFKTKDGVQIENCHIDNIVCDGEGNYNNVDTGSDLDIYPSEEITIWEFTATSENIDPDTLQATIKDGTITIYFSFPEVYYSGTYEGTFTFTAVLLYNGTVVGEEN